MEPLDSNSSAAPSSTDVVSEPSSPPTIRSSSGWFDIVVVLSLVVLPAVVPSFLEIAYGRLMEMPKFALQSCLTTISSQLPLLLLVCYLMSRSGQSWASFGIRRPTSITDWAIASVAFAAYWYFGGLLGDVADGIFGSHQHTSFAKPRSIREVPVTIVEMLMIGFAEEFVWRSYLQTRFRDVLQSRWQAVFVTSLLFGLMHLYQGLSAVVVTMLFGLIVGSFFEWRRQIIPMALMHALINFVLVMLQPD